MSTSTLLDGGKSKVCDVLPGPGSGTFLSGILACTITEQMREESRYLRSHWQARLGLKEIVEMPDQQADRVIRSIEQNKGKLTNALVKEMPILQQPGVWDQIVDVVTRSSREDASADRSVVE